MPILGEVSAHYRANKMVEEWQGPTKSVQLRGMTVRRETVGRISKEICYVQWLNK